MLKYVHSKFIIRILFFHINEKVKLKLVKYNKSLQNIIHVDLINYKLYKGNYVIYDSNGIGKEYNSFNDKLVYKGEYSKGERNGKGEEYDYEGKLIYEGEFLNGKRNGKGKEYKGGNLIFEGEYLNGKRWIKNDSNIKLINIINGKVNIIDHRKISNIKIEYLNENDEKTNDNNKLLIGVGYIDKKLHFNNFIEKKNNFMQKYNSPNVIYELQNGKLYIIEYNDYEDLKYEGEFFNGKRNGKGKEYDDNSNLIFEGEYFNGKRWNGIGYDGNNLVYELKNGNGWVKEFNNKKLLYEGEYING